MVAYTQGSAGSNGGSADFSRNNTETTAAHSEDVEASRTARTTEHKIKLEDSTSWIPAETTVLKPTKNIPAQ